MWNESPTEHRLHCPGLYGVIDLVPHYEDPRDSHFALHHGEPAIKSSKIYVVPSARACITAAGPLCV